MDSNTLTLTIHFKDDGTASVIDQAKSKVSDLDKTIDSTTKGSLARMKDGWMAITAKIGIATAAFYGAKRLIYDTALQIASATNDIERQAKVLGMDTDELQKWQYAAKMSDVNAQELALGIKLLSRNMEDASSGTGESSKYFSAMGVAVKTTEGHLRPLNDVMGDIMDKFASWEDGPRKIAISMNLFGRSGETLIPLLNKGKVGFSEFAAEAQKLGIILSPDLIKKGSEAEDIFKKINLQVEAGKLKFAPYGLAVAKFVNEFLDNVNKIKKWKEENEGIFNFIFGTLPIPGANLLTQLNSIKKIREEAEAFSKIKMPEMAGWYVSQPLKKAQPPPGTPSAEKKNIVSAFEYPWEAYREQAQKYAEIVNSIVKKNSEDILAAEIEYINSSIGEYQRWGQEQLEIGKESYEKRLSGELNYINSSIAEYQRWGGEQIEIGKQSYDQRLADEKNYIDSSIAEYQRWGAEQVEIAKNAQDQIKKQEEENARMMEGIGSSIGTIWSSNVTAMLEGQKTFAQGFKDIWADMADYAIQQILRIAANYAIFGNTQGTYSSGAGLIGIIGSAIGLQEGGSFWVNRPTPLIVGEGGQREFVSVTPESQMGRGGGGTTIVNYQTHYHQWNLQDAQTARDFVRRNRGAYLEIIKEDADSAGVMRNIIKGMR